MSLLVLVAVLVLFLISKLEPQEAVLFAALAVAILASGWQLAVRRVA